MSACFYNLVLDGPIIRHYYSDVIANTCKMELFTINEYYITVPLVLPHDLSNCNLKYVDKL